MSNFDLVEFFMSMHETQPTNSLQHLPHEAEPTSNIASQSAETQISNESSTFWLKGRIPSLDGLRAVSILLVTVEHLCATTTGSPVPELLRKYLSWGYTGVDVFFVISGFLISHLLLQESIKYGRISLWDFYIKRAFRIMPAYYVFLLVLWILGSAGVLSIKPLSLLLSATYTINLTTGYHTDANGHCWSLCVEEHFYLIWPAALVIFGRRTALYWFVLPVFFIGLAGRFIIWFSCKDMIDIDRFTFTRLDAIAGGCVMAVFAHSKRGKAAAAFVVGRADWITMIATASLMISVLVLSSSGKYDLGPRRPIEAALIATIVFVLVADNRSYIARLLNTRPIVYVGVLSYSLYLAQTFSTAGSSPGWPFGWWWNLPLTIGYALFSYHLVERPALWLKERWAENRSLKKR